jgi:hypothetical protein
MKDWRAWAVFTTVIVAYAVTLIVAIVFKDQLQQKWIDTLVGFYTSWSTSVLFFTLVGIAALIYSTPSQPDTISFSERVRSFYGSLAPTVLRDYARDQMKKFGGFNKSLDRELEITEYNSNLEAYKIECRSIFFIKNIFLDVEYEDDPTLRILVDKFQNPPTPMGQMHWIYLNQQNVLGGGVQDIPEEGFSRPLAIKIQPDSEMEYKYKYWVWHKIDTESNQRPKRVTVESRTKIRNSMASGIVPVRLLDETRTVEIGPGQEYVFPPIRNATPNDLIFRFELGRPG